MVETSRSSEKVYLITGAASGLGRRLATDLAALGRRLALFDRNSEELEETVAALRAGRRRSDRSRGRRYRPG